MAVIKFGYKKENNILRPVADIGLRYEEKRIEASMYIDSGADISLIPLRFGKFFDFKEDTEKIKEMRGLTGEIVPYIIQEISFLFPGYQFKGKIGWALIEEVPLILGRLDIFDRFKIIFDEAEKSITFVPRR